MEAGLHKIGAQAWTGNGAALKGFWEAAIRIPPLSMVGFANAAAYAASKHAILGLTKVAALEYSAQGIRINAVCPGFIKTAMIERGLGQLPNSEQVMEQVAQLNAIGRMGKPEEVANVVLFLASDEASFITGAAYLVDRGYTAGNSRPKQVRGAPAAIQ